MVLFEMVGGALIALQFATAMAVFSFSKKAVGSLASSASYIFVSFVLIAMGTATYMFGNILFTETQVSVIAASYMIMGFSINIMKLLVIDPKAKETKIETVSKDVQEFFGD